jgi:hypothetical protein
MVKLHSKRVKSVKLHSKRVKSVKLHSKRVGKIALGISKSDTLDDLDYCLRKCANCRVFTGENDPKFTHQKQPEKSEDLTTTLETSRKHAPELAQAEKEFFSDECEPWKLSVIDREFEVSGWGWYFVIVSPILCKCF